MKFNCDSGPLAYALNKCSRMVKFKESYPEARNVLIVAENNCLSLSVTDVISGSVTYYVTDTVSVLKPGTITVDARSMSIFVSAIAGTIQGYITQAGRLMIKSGSKKMSFAPSTAIPMIPEMDEDAHSVCSMEGSILQSVLSISFMAADENSTIPSLRGVLIMFDGQNIYSMAASSNRAAYTWYSLESKGKGKFLLPPDAVSLLSYYLYEDDTVGVFFDGKKVWFRTARFIMSTVQIGEDFPVQAISDMVNLEKPYSFTVGNDDLKNVLDTCFGLARVTADKSKRIHFEASATYSLLRIKTDEANEIGDLDWSIVIKKHDNQGFRFTLSTRYLENILNALEKLRTSDLMVELRGGNNITISVGQAKENLGTIYMQAPTMQALFLLAPMGFPELIEE